MKKSLLTIAGIILLLPAVAYADLQCYSSVSGYTQYVNVQSGTACQSYDEKGYLYDTSSEKWSDPTSGRELASPGSAVTTSGQLSDRCVNTPANCTVEENVFLNGQTAIQNQGATCPSGQVWSSTAGCTTPTQTNTINTANTNSNTSNGQLTYIPLEPLCTGSNCPTRFGAGGADFPAYVANTYRTLVTLGSILAVVLLVVGGIRYMLSEATNDLEKSKKQMQAALWGLAIVVGSFLILYTLNPNLLNFNLNPQGIAPQPLIPPSVTSPTRTNLTLEDARRSLDKDITDITTKSDDELKQKYNSAACASIRTDSTKIGSEYSRIRMKINVYQANQEPYKSQLEALLVEQRQNNYDGDQCKKYGN